MTLKNLTRFLCSIILASAPLIAAATEANINSEMQKAAKSLTELMPFIYSDKAFRDAGNRPHIEQNINNLITIIEGAPKLMDDHAVTMIISQQNLLATLKQANTLFETGAYATSQYLLSGVPVVCSSCHIQDGRQSALQLSLDRSTFANDFSFAEFNYYLRNYEQAQQSYLKHLDELSIQRSRIQSRKTLERLLDIALITNQNSQNAEAILERAQTLPNLDNESKAVSQQWLAGMKNLAFDTPALSELEKSIYAAFDEQFTLEHEFIFKEENRPKALLWRKQLHQNLRSKHSDKESALALYLLSILERALGDQIDLSLAHLYLKECIHLKAPPYSGKCLNEYENHLYFYYGGSSGEHLPAEVQEELQSLKQQFHSDQ